MTLTGPSAGATGGAAVTEHQPGVPAIPDDDEAALAGLAPIAAKMGMPADVLLASLRADADAQRQPEARAVCEHFYASHCYRGMSIRLCMMCHQPDWDDLERQLREAIHVPPGAVAPCELPGTEPHVPALPEPDTAGMDAGAGIWRERAEAAEGKLAGIEELCADRSAPFFFAADILAIIGDEGESRG